MQQHKFVQYLILLLICIPQLLFSQQINWYQLYQDNDIGTLEQLVKEGQLQDGDWQQFIRILSSERGDEALAAFLRLYANTGDENLKKCVLDRVSQYYYSRGFYETASRVIEDKSFREQFFSLKQKEIFFGVQLGAYSTYQNAVEARKKVNNQISNISVLSKNHKGKILYVVIAGKFRTRKKAVQLKNNLYQKFQQKGLVVQFQGDE